MALGKKGRSALFGEEIKNDEKIKKSSSKKEEIKSNGVFEVTLSQVEPNRSQPRKTFDNDKISALADSIRQHGIIQPLVVTKLENDRYSIVAGERRWRAAKLAGIKKVPVVVREYSPETVMEVALIENLQREDLNPIEEALGYQSLLDEFDLTQEMISEKIGKSRSAIANSLRLLSLNEAIQKLLISGEITSGHARAALSINDKQMQRAFIERVINDGINVRQAERLAKQMKKTTPKKKEKTDAYALELEAIGQKLSSGLGTKVIVSYGAKKGKIEIEYYGNDDLERILEQIGISR